VRWHDNLNLTDEEKAMVKECDRITKESTEELTPQHIEFMESIMFRSIWGEEEYLKSKEKVKGWTLIKSEKD
jgi:hypothetical protein